MERLREMLDQLKLHFQVELAMADILEDLGKRIEALEQYKLKNETAHNVMKKQYSECLMVLKDINRKLDSRS